MPRKKKYSCPLCRNAWNESELTVDIRYVHAQRATFKRAWCTVCDYEIVPLTRIAGKKVDVNEVNRQLRMLANGETGK